MVRSCFLDAVSNDIIRQIDAYSLPDAHDALKRACRRVYAAIGNASCPFWYREARASAVEWVCSLPETIRLHPTFRVGYISSYEKKLFGIADDIDTSSVASISSAIAVSMAYGCSSARSGGTHAASSTTHQSSLRAHEKPVISRHHRDGDSLRILIHLLCLNPTNKPPQAPSLLLPSSTEAAPVEAPLPSASLHTLTTTHYQGGVSTTYQLTGQADTAPLFPGMDSYGKRERIVVNWGCNLPIGVVPTNTGNDSEAKEVEEGKGKDILADQDALPEAGSSPSLPPRASVTQTTSVSEGTLSIGAHSMDPTCSRSLGEYPQSANNVMSKDDAAAAAAPIMVSPRSGPTTLLGLGGAPLFARNPTPEVEWVSRWQSSIVSASKEAIRMFGVGLVRGALPPSPMHSTSSPMQNNNNDFMPNATQEWDSAPKHFIVCVSVGGMSIDPALNASRGLCLITSFCCVPAGWGGPLITTPCGTCWHLDLSSTEALQLLHPAHIDNQTEMVIASHPRVLQHLRHLRTPYQSPVSMRDPRQVDVGMRLPKELFQSLLGFGACGNNLLSEQSAARLCFSPLSPNTMESASLQRARQSRKPRSNQRGDLFASEDDESTVHSETCGSSDDDEEYSASEGSLDGDLYARSEQGHHPPPTTASDLLKRCFLDPITEAVQHLEKDIVTIQEIIVDLTTPKGIWKCSTGTGAVTVVDAAELWAKRREQLGIWGRRHLQTVLNDLVVNGGFPVNLTTPHLNPVF